MKLFLRVLAAALALAAGNAALAHGHRYWGPRVGIYVGPPLSPWYYPPAYYYPPVIAVPAPPPPVYIEQPATPVPPAQSYWYYCASPSGYYPYVKECPGGWQQVLPQP